MFIYLQHGREPAPIDFDGDLSYSTRPTWKPESATPNTKKLRSVLWGQNETEWAGKVELEAAKILAEGEACMAIF